MDSFSSPNKLRFHAEFVGAWFALIFLLWFSGCASVSVDKINRIGLPPAAPKRIYVQDFEIAKENLRVDRDGPELEQFRKRFSQQLTLAIVKRVRKRLGASSALRRNARIGSTSAWLVSGQFLTVNQGSRALRAVVGFGAGGTKVETRVTVYDLSDPKPRLFLKFITTGGSNAQPGAMTGLIAPNYWLLAVNIIGKGLPGLNADVLRTSRQIVAMLSESIVREGFISSDKVSYAKRLGQLPKVTDQSDFIRTTSHHFNKRV